MPQGERATLAAAVPEPSLFPFWKQPMPLDEQATLAAVCFHLPLFRFQKGNSHDRC
ncbi:hypothetical protein [Streptomyces sp. NRRL S-813]|uniref:hypothetical protein n=1 Tax=Streptomyces sp. NRRL S-813 TaxID=1463919 RepID=UPI00131BC1FF|nr:hypothetical protein [Streptomyces sp. NRRL S-813]